MKKIFISLICIGLFMLFYVRFIGTYGLEIKEYSIVDNTLPSNFEGVKIVHISDIHYGSIVDKKRLDNIVDEVNKQKPDIVIFTGDLYDESIVVNDRVKEEITSSLKNIKSNIGSYAVIGNHDYSDTVYKELIESSNFTYLENESRIIYYGDGDPIELIGYDDAWKSTPDYSIELSGYYKMALIHEPDEVDNILDKNIRLVFAGHSHGGQVRFPIVGAVHTPQGAKKYTNDYYEFGSTKLYVSYGIGTSLLKFRYFNHPSINVYRLYKN